MPINNGKIEVFDHIQIPDRKGGWKVHFRKDQAFRGLTDINLIYEYAPRMVLSEHLAYELFRKAGSLTPTSGHLRVWAEGKPRGFFLMVEQPNRNLLRRNDREENSNLYKQLWYGQSLEEQHEKKNNLNSGHEDLRLAVRGLQQLKGKPQWEWIQQNFNVLEFVNYYVVNQCIQNWDGYFNNYTVYHDTKPAGKWGIIPWDEDKTWGDYDGASAGYDWYEMPLDYGKTGSKPPSGLMNMMNRGPFGPSPWWRPPGWFSGPLLANSEFEKQFHARLKSFCLTEFTETQFFPVIAKLEKQLSAEVQYRATLFGQDPKVELAQFKRHIDSFRRQVHKRRDFLLRELEKVGAGKVP